MRRTILVSTPLPAVTLRSAPFWPFPSWTSRNYWVCWKSLRRAQRPSTTVLSWVVIVLALVLGWMVGRAGWKTAVSLFKGQTDAVSVVPETQQTNASSKKKAPNFGIMSAPPRWVGKKKESASSNASTSDTSQAKEEAEPPFAGGLRVYQNGRVIFRIGPSVEKPTQMPVELAAQTTTYEATPIDP